jgi:GT2 family glycosyltransferase
MTPKDIFDGLMSPDLKIRAEALRALAVAIQSGQVATFGAIVRFVDGSESITIGGLVDEKLFYGIHQLLRHVDEEIRTARGQGPTFKVPIFSMS